MNFLCVIRNRYKINGTIASMKHSKVISLSEAVHIAEKQKKAKKKVVTTNGCFDILHVGHARSFRMAKKLGDVLMVGVNSDASVRANKGASRPIVPDKERAELVASLESVDYVFIFGSKTPTSWLSKIKPSVHVKGSDRTIEEIPERHMIEKNGGKLVLIPHTGKHSTSGIIKKIQEL